MKSYKQFSEEYAQLDERLRRFRGPGGGSNLGGGRGRGRGRNNGGGPGNLIGPAAATAAHLVGGTAKLGLNALKNAGGLAANALKGILDGDKDEGGEKVSKSHPLKNVEKHT